MKAPSCLTVEQLDTLKGLPAEDPLRTHAGECPRCRALVESYELFLAPGPEAHAPHVLDADVKLAAALERIVGTPPDATRVARPEATGDEPWWQRLLAPAWRPAWALAAVAILAGGVYLATQRDGTGPEVLRGTESTESGGSALVVVSAARTADGGVRLSWRRHPEAGSYLVRFYSSDLNELGQLGPVADTSLTVSPELVPFLGAPRHTVLFRVHAYAEGDEIAASRARALEKP